MLPSLVARDVVEGLKSYIRCEFPIATDGFIDEDGRSILEAYLAEKDALVKGPWIEVKLPFRQSDEKAPLPFTHLPMERLIPGFVPYMHQRRAFERLAWQHAQSTIVATGTGSGKTECFLLPILDYCLANRAPGIKAILIYPMNALASDQAKRIEKLIQKLPEAKLRVGMYTGESQAGEGKKVMRKGAIEIITAREALRANPPDILLTNYKMLDFLLMRPEDQGLWRGNGPEVLRYLVVDELHTFDGAQGTDLACLIRRLRDRLHLGSTLACVGTSATIGGPSSVDALCRYASSVFATHIGSESVIEEDRLSASEYLASFGELAPIGQWPDLSLLDYERSASNVSNNFSMIMPLWFNESLGFDGYDEISDEAMYRLGQALPHLEGFRRLVHDVQGVTDLGELAQKWAREVPELKDMFDEKERLALARATIDSLIAMVAMARNERFGRPVPFLTVRSQLWVRTLSRAVASVSRHPKLALSRELPSLMRPLYLPVVGCRECNNTAWATTMKGGPRGSDRRIKPDLNLFYDSWFSAHRDTLLMYPVTDGRFFDEHRADMYRVCPDCGRLTSAAAHEWAETEKGEDYACACGSHNAVLVWIPEMTKESDTDEGKKTKFDNMCPHCFARGSLRIFGAAASSLSAAVIDHLHASGFNGDNKIIAFSDSVQDAAQRAGFLGARDYTATCRHAVMHYIQSQPIANDMLLRQLIKGLSSFWFDYFRRLIERAFRDELSSADRETLAKAAFLATFMPPDKAWKHSWAEFDAAALASFRERVLQPIEQDATNVEAAATSLRLVWVSRVEAILSTKNTWEPLYQDVYERLAWEALMEFGFRSENGRTLTRAGLAQAYPNPAAIKGAADELRRVLRDEFGFESSRETVERYLTGFLHHMKMLGAFDAQGLKSLGFEQLELSFGGYIQNGVDYKAFNMSPVLPSFGQRRRAPTAPTLKPFKRDNFNVPMLTQRGRTWFTYWIEKLFTVDQPLIGAQTEDVLVATLKALEQRSFLRKVDREDGNSAWVMPLLPWHVGRNVRTWRCNCCGRRYYATDDQMQHANLRIWTGMPCHSSFCHGTLVEDQLPGKNNVYLAPPVRINAREHTALIDSETRKRIENNFGTTDYPWSVNLLSATSTLEMGIDIGDLSTVLLCSMPPEQANYLQRIGRAGRKDGNAIAITMVDKSAHAQYFWQDPKEMLEGEVSTPGVFLRAVSVLERQLMAFAIGRWVSSTTPSPKLPETLRTVLINYCGNRTELFPLKFFEWANEHADELLTGFMRLFEQDGQSELTEEARAVLREYLLPNSEGLSGMVSRMRASLDTAQAQFENYQRTVASLKRVRDRIEKRPQDPNRDFEISEVEAQRHAMMNLISQNFTKKPFFNFMTDEGLLPNYAFPEEGVQVHSLIVKRRDRRDTGGGGAENSVPRATVESFDFSRAMRSALGELAPNSLFYAKEYILKVDQLHLTDDSLETWRFCPECAHAEKVLLEREPPTACPHCGSPLFADNGRLKTLMRVHEITATADAKRDRIVDDQEERHSEFVARHVLIDVDEKNIANAWRVKDERFNFGFEFLKRVTIREINFGPMLGGANAAPFKVAGQDFPQVGYKVCRHCGKVHKPFPRPGERQHDYNCPFYGKEEDPKNSPWVEGLFLYREMQSEAIRIRIPVCDMVDESGAEIGTASFMAAIRLGLKRYFKGAVDHLEVALQTEPVPDSANGRNRYIVIYDTIPGGSGYLKDLGRMDHFTGKPEVMQSMFREAWRAVSTCRCASDPNRDGCYHCVYQYRDGESRAEISRKEAEVILRRVASYRPEQIEPMRSLSDMPSLDMSVLEALMVKRLSRMPGTTFTSLAAKDGATHYEIVTPLSTSARAALERLTGKDPGERFTWVMQPQPDFRSEVRASRPDFVIRPRQEALSAKFPQLTSYLFTDGWEFHASSLSEDTEKRQAILNEGHRVWSLTWQDLAEEEGESDAAANAPRYGRVLMREQGRAGAARYWQSLFAVDFVKKGLCAAQASPNFAELAAERLLRERATSFDWLRGWLADPVGFSESMREAMHLALLSQRAVSDGPEVSAQNRDDNPAPLFVDMPTGKRAWFRSQAGLPMQMLAMVSPADDCIVRAALRLDDREFSLEKNPRLKSDERQHARWAAFWQSANAMQFLERVWICTRSNDENAVFTMHYEPKRVVTPSVSPFLGAAVAWEEIMEELASDAEFFAHIQPLAEALLAQELPAPLGLVDGFSERVVCAGQGLEWRIGNRQIYLFAKEDLEEPLDVPETDNLLVLSTAAPDWQSRLVTALAQ